MTKEQIDILLKDGDIITGEGLVYLQEKEYKLSKTFHEALKEIFEWYLHGTLHGDGLISGSIELYRKRIKSVIDELNLSKEQQRNFLNSKIQEEISCLDNLRSDFFFEQSIKDIKESWLYHLLDKIGNIIEVLKFKILKGEKIKSFDFTFINSLPHLNLLDEYFLSQNMLKIYKAAAIEENIKFLQETINETRNENKAPYEMGHEVSPLDNEQSSIDLLNTTIEEWLCPFKDSISESGYSILIQALKDYFHKGKFPKLSKKIIVAKVNKKRFGWALNRIYRSQKSNPLTIEYLLFAKENISLFADVEFDELRFKESNLYKYFTTKN